MERLKSNPLVLINPFIKTVIKSIKDQKVKSKVRDSEAQVSFAEPKANSKFPFLNQDGSQRIATLQTRPRSLNNANHSPRIHRQTEKNSRPQYDTVIPSPIEKEWYGTSELFRSKDAMSMPLTHYIPPANLLTASSKPLL